MTTDALPDAAGWLNENVTGWDRAMGLRFLHASGDRVDAEVELREQHLQPYGLAHGGVHAGVIEAVCSTGAALWALPLGLRVVGLENSTSFLRAVREGRLAITASPVTRGRRSQVWQAEVRDAQGNLLAQGRVRLLCLDADASLAGGALKVPGEPTPSP
jgi:uncharacterized protein (TIGR00369 family)